MIKNVNQKKRLYIGILNKDVKEQYLIELFGFNATTCLRGNCCVDLTTVKNEKNKGFGFAVMPEHVQKELLKLHGIDFHGNIIIIEEAASAKIKRLDEQNTRLSGYRLKGTHAQGSTTEVVNDSSENVDSIRSNTLPCYKSYTDVAMLLYHVTRKTVLPKK